MDIPAQYFQKLIKILPTMDISRSNLCSGFLDSPKFMVRGRGLEIVVTRDNMWIDGHLVTDSKVEIKTFFDHVSAQNDSNISIEQKKRINATLGKLAKLKT